MARPAGPFVIRGNDVTWRPAVDVDRIIAGVFAVAALGLIVAFRRSK